MSAMEAEKIEILEIGKTECIIELVNAGKDLLNLEDGHKVLVDPARTRLEAEGILDLGVRRGLLVPEGQRGILYLEVSSLGVFLVKSIEMEVILKLPIVHFKMEGRFDESTRLTMMCSVQCTQYCTVVDTALQSL